jgi:poly(3-hydroxybutyrate) depolymerase
MAIGGRLRRSLSLGAFLLVATIVRVDAADPIQIPKALEPHLAKELVAIFEPGKLAMRADAGYEELEYRLFAPQAESSPPPKGYPLILFFNGHGPIQMNHDDLGPLKHLQATIFADPKRPENYPFYLLAIRCPKNVDNKWLNWFNQSGSNRPTADVEPIEAAMLALSEIAATHPIDRNRISLFGISSGGAAAWELAMRYPDRFSAMVPTACAGGDVARLNQICDLPVWAFHSTGDNPEAIEKTISTLKAAGGNAHLTLIDSEKHDCWTAAFQKHDLLKWMLAQNRERQANAGGFDDYLKSVSWHEWSYPVLSPRGRAQAWSELWPRAIPALAILGIALLYRRESRRQRLRAAAVDHSAPATEPPVQEAIHEESATA